jgi:hypothetical protein
VSLPDEGGTPPDTSPQKDGESWSDYWARSHRNSNSGKTRYPWGNDAWPGSDQDKNAPKGNGPDIDRTELQNIAKALRQDLATYFTGDGQQVGGSAGETKCTRALLSEMYDISPSQVGAGAVDTAGLTWDVANTFYGTLSKSRQSMIDAHDAFVAAFEDVITRYEKTVGISQDAETQNQNAVKNSNNLY